MSEAVTALTDVVERISLLAGDAGLRRGDVLDVARLSYDTGIPPRTVEALLNGDDVAEEDLKARVSSRFQALRRTRLRADQRAYSLKQIAESFNASGPSLSAVAKGEGLPGVEHLLGIQRFFKVHDGFLLAEDTTALQHALQQVLKELECRTDPWAAVSDRHGIRRTACRAEQLSSQNQMVVQASLAAIVDTLLSHEGKA
ncbi:transcriptional regulator [Streptomyces sp. NPDC058572]|uniref:transcriptional regulator n=1 Tax=Streptomyces sp. NPDC058572 TaxID=3346546 RepID=UPI00365ABB3F